MKTARETRRPQVANAFGTTLREAREREGLDRAGLARLAGLNSTYPGLIESGRRSPSLTTILLLSVPLRTHASILVEDTVSLSLGRRDEGSMLHSLSSVQPSGPVLSATDQAPAIDILLIIRRLASLAFGQVLLEARQLRCLTRWEFAKQVGLDRTYLSLLERGLKTMSLLILLEIAEGLDITPGLLVAKTVALLKAAATARSGSSSDEHLSMAKAITAREGRAEYYRSELEQLQETLRNPPSTHYARLVNEIACLSPQWVAPNRTQKK